MGEYWWNRTTIHTHQRTHSSPYRAQVFVLHLLELGIGVAGTQLHISQHHLEHCVVDGLGEVHVQLVHSSLQREKRTKHTVTKTIRSGCHRHMPVWVCKQQGNCKSNFLETCCILDILNYLHN